MYLCADLNSKGDCVYVIESDSLNHCMWSYNIGLRDTHFKVGMVLGVPDPDEITDMCGDQVPIIQCNGGMALMYPPVSTATVPIEAGVGSSTRWFHYPSVRMTIRKLYAFDGSCIGKFCDGQTVKDIHGTNKGCGCYVQTRGYSKIVLVHDVTIEIGEGESIVINGFASRQFSDFYLSTHLSQCIQFCQLDGTPALRGIRAAARNVVNYVNVRGGWSVHGWYKRGEIKDASNLDVNETSKIASGEINFHLSLVQPRVEPQQAAHDELKFDTDSIQQDGGYAEYRVHNRGGEIHDNELHDDQIEN